MTAIPDLSGRSYNHQLPKPFSQDGGLHAYIPFSLFAQFRHFDCKFTGPGVPIPVIFRSRSVPAIRFAGVDSAGLSLTRSGSVPACWRKKEDRPILSDLLIFQTVRKIVTIQIMPSGHFFRIGRIRYFLVFLIQCLLVCIQFGLFGFDLLRLGFYIGFQSLILRDLALVLADYGPDILGLRQEFLYGTAGKEHHEYAARSAPLICGSQLVLEEFVLLTLFFLSSAELIV